MAATNGGRSRRAISSIEPETVAIASWLSTLVLPWPGKCLTHAATPADCSPVTAAAACRATRSGSAPNDLRPDDGIVGRGVDVDRRRQVQVDAERRQVGAERPVHRSRQGGVVDRAERGVARVRAAGQVRDPGDVAALLVDRDDRLVPRGPTPRGPQRRDQRGKLGRCCRCWGRTRSPRPVRRRAPRAPTAGPPGRGTAGSAAHRPAGQARGRRRPARSRGHPFTAPATSPPTSRRRTMRKKIITGIVYSVDAAMIGPHCAPPRPKK